MVWRWAGNRGNRDMAAQHDHQIVAFDGMSRSFRRILWLVIVMNAAMFVVEMLAGALAGSQALKADALDFLGDTATYLISLLVIGRSVRARTNAALIKGASLAVMGLWVLTSTLYQILILGEPNAPIMGSIGFLALATNLSSVLLLLRYRNGDANIRSIWLCSRNDTINNIAVMLAAGAVWLSKSAWPDLIAASFMAALFFYGALQIIRQALVERRTGQSI